MSAAKENKQSAEKRSQRSFAVELYFDSALENQILKIWNVLARRQLSSVLIDLGSRPHLSLSLHKDIDPSKLRTAMENFAQQQQPTAVTLTAIGGFSNSEGVLFLVPVPTLQILSLHEHFQELLKRLGIQPESRVLPGQWFPHCTIAEDVQRDKMRDSFGLLQSFRLPLTGHLCDLALVEYRPAQEHFSFPLGGDFT